MKSRPYFFITTSFAIFLDNPPTKLTDH